MSKKQQASNSGLLWEMEMSQLDAFSPECAFPSLGQSRQLTCGKTFALGERGGKKAIDFNRISPQTLLNRVKTCTKKNHCINILPKKGRFALTPSTASSFVAIYSMRQSNLEKIHLSSLTTFWCDFRELYCLFMWK
ncbi:hypothetical protein AV530_018807 [Patagioenas fasciata monilis]|uniref:Uncharacterized protein n=1 Tax=Patagioenas fasciata monilis TaxID=372326 RepID=A0A1V4JJK6_PATFA|nr:hypothetical protein AV530_018807 [Patagioenas fasciata monilis]